MPRKKGSQKTTKETTKPAKRTRRSKTVEADESRMNSDELTVQEYLGISLY